MKKTPNWLSLVHHCSLFCLLGTRGGGVDGFWESRINIHWGKASRIKLYADYDKCLQIPVKSLLRLWHALTLLDILSACRNTEFILGSIGTVAATSVRGEQKFSIFCHFTIA